MAQHFFIFLLERTLLGDPGIATRNKKLLETSASLLVTSATLLGARTLLGAPGLTDVTWHRTRNKKLLGVLERTRSSPAQNFLNLRCTAAAASYLPAFFSNAPLVLKTGLFELLSQPKGFV